VCGRVVRLPVLISFKSSERQLVAGLQSARQRVIDRALDAGDLPIPRLEEVGDDQNGHVQPIAQTLHATVFSDQSLKIKAAHLANGLQVFEAD